MKNYLQKLLSGQPLSTVEAREMICLILDGEVNDAQIVAAITALIIRPIQLNELLAFRDEVLSRAEKPELITNDAIDVCGTGGDGKDTFNISTTASFVIAAAGYKVIKHGNYGVSSKCGSSTVLEALGYNFTNDSETLNRHLEDYNICFLHAPLFHPVLKSVGALRRDLGLRSFFNFLGPLLNPVQPKYQLTGVYGYELIRLYQEILEKERDGYAVVHGLSGFDELSLTDDFVLASKGYQQRLRVGDLGLPKYELEDLKGGENTQASANILINVLSGNGTSAQTDVVLANAALGIQCFDKNKTFEDAFAEAKAALGNDLPKKFEGLLELRLKTKDIGH